MSTGDSSVKVEGSKDIDPRCIVIFRPLENWVGEYGFDWFREENDREKSKEGNGLESSQYRNPNLVGRYCGDILICTPEGTPILLRDKDEFTDRYNSPLYRTNFKNSNSNVFIFYSKKECLGCSIISECELRNSGQTPFVYKKNKRIKVDPDSSRPNEYGEYNIYTLKFKESDNYNHFYVEDFEKKYNPIRIKSSNNNAHSDEEYYYVPTISLFYKDSSGKCKVTLKLKIKAELGVERIVFECDKGITCLKEGKAEILIDHSHPNQYYEDTVDVTFTEEFMNNNQDVFIKVIAENDKHDRRTLAGKLCVERSIPKSVDIIFVPIGIPIDGKVSFFQGMRNHAGYLKSFLNQAQVIPNIYWLSFFRPKTLEKLESIINNDMVNELNSQGHVIGKVLKNDELGNKLEKLFNEEYPKYRNIYKIFLMGAKGEGGLLGMANGIPSKAAVIFSLEGEPNTASTICHELLHCFGLYHSFSNESPYTFKEGKTSNIMDYPVSPFKLQTLWKWQWDKIQSAKGVRPMDESFIRKILPKPDLRQLPKVKIL